MLIMYCTSKMSFKSPQVVITDAAAKAFSLQVEMSQTSCNEVIKDSEKAITKLFEIHGECS